MRGDLEDLALLYFDLLARFAVSSAEVLGVVQSVVGILDVYILSIVWVQQHYPEEHQI